MEANTILILLGILLAVAIIGLVVLYHQKNQVKTSLEVAKVNWENERKLREEEKAESEQEMQEAKTEWERQRNAAKDELVKQIALMKEEGDKRRQEALESLEKSYEERLKTQKQHNKDTLDKLEQAHKERLDTQEKHYKEAIEEQQNKFDETISKMTAQLRLATDEMLKQRQQEFAESSNNNLGQIVNPLKETIEQMKQVMNDSTLKQTELSSDLKANIENMMRQSEAAKMSTEELTRVFKHGSKVQGDWGETVLNELLEAQGLTEGIHYDLQPYIKDAQGQISKSEEGSMMRPDVILHLDQRREVIIDSKVSLTAFMDYSNANTEEERKRLLKAHIDSLKSHVRELSTKDYSSYIQPPKARMDYVIMFVPHSAALWTALNAQPDLWRNAMAQNVFIADEQTLFAALRIINLTWTQIAQAQNHEKVYALANELLERVGQFMKKYQDIGTALERATKAYEDGGRKLAPQGQSILTTCAKLQKLGAKQSDKNPLPQITDIDDIPQLETNDET